MTRTRRHLYIHIAIYFHKWHIDIDMYHPPIPRTRRGWLITHVYTRDVSAIGGTFDMGTFVEDL